MSKSLTGEDRAALLRAICEAPDFLTAAGRRRFVRDIFRPFAYFSELDANQLQDVNWEGKPRVVGDELLRVLDGHEAGPGVGAVAVLAAAVLPKAREEAEVPPMRDYRGEQLGHFLIGEEIGRGGQAVVYRAVDDRNRMVVAVKILGNLPADSAGYARALREVTLPKFDHPAVVQPLEEAAFTKDGCVYFPMRLFCGNLGRKRKVPWGEAARMVHRLADALMAIHPHAIHQDLKPENILVDEAGEVYIADLGLALPQAERHEREWRGRAAGTWQFMAPEVFKKFYLEPTLEAADARADVYSLGMILYELLTGTYPFGGDWEARKASLANPPTSPDTLAPEIPTALAKVCMDCLRVDLAERIPSAKKLQERLAVFVGAPRGGYLERLIREVEAKARLYSPLSGVGTARRPDGAEALLAAWDDPDIVLLTHSSRRRETVETREYDDILTAFRDVKRAALLGAPGGGKSTTLRRLALELAQRALRDVTAPWPVMVELGRWVGDESLLAFLAAETPDCEIRLERVVLLLDGLNEVPTGKRGRKAREVRELAGRAAVIVSCRAEDYTGELDLGLDTLTLEPMTPQRVRAALRQWVTNGGVEAALGEQIFWELAGDAGLAGVLEKWRRAGATEEEFWGAGNVDDHKAVYKATSGAEDTLWQKHVRNPRSLLQLAANPFLLTMLYQVRVAEGSLPQNRGELFDRFIRRLLSRERLLVRNGVSGEWRMQAAGQALLDGLAELAWDMNRDRGVLTVIQRSAAEAALGGTLLTKVLDSTILEGGDELRFRHQLFQEYFTARAMRDRLGELRASELWPAERWWERTGWEEATVLLAGLYAADCTPVIRWVAEAQPEVAVKCLEESGARPLKEGALVTELGRLWRPRLLGETAPEARAAVGRALGRLNLDERPGVGLRKDGVPDIDWVYIPGGGVIHQEGERRFIETFYMARYQVTNAQFQAFLDDPNGYVQDCWWAGFIEPERSPAKGAWGEANSARESVNWRDAMVFCAWLSDRVGYTVTLPTEWQWERAARGTEGRAYPWGNGYVAGFANIDETWQEEGPHYLGRTSAVGIYPMGSSPEGVMDLSGNVWEWCLNEYKEPKRIHETGTEPQVLRGGSWATNMDGACAALRNYYHPGLRSYDFGFRLVCSSPIR